MPVPTLPVASTLRAFMVERFLIDDSVGDEVDLFEQGVVDSFGLVEMITFLETSFEIAFAKAEFMSPRLHTMGGIIGLVQEKRGGS